MKLKDENELSIDISYVDYFLVSGETAYFRKKLLVL